MKKSLAILLLSSATVFGGELPELFEKPWTAWYSGYEGKKIHFGVDPDGHGFLIPLEKKSGDRVTQRAWFIIKPMIEEILPNGKTTAKSSKEDGWEAITKESAEAEKVSFRGTVTGGATYEVNLKSMVPISFAKADCSTRGELTKNPIRFAMQVVVPNAYGSNKKEEELNDILKGDRVDFVLSDKKRKKFKGLETGEAAAKEAQSIASARVDYEGFKGPRLELDAGDNGVFDFFRPSGSPLGKGFVLRWAPDPAKNTKGEAAMVITFK